MLAWKFALVLRNDLLRGTLKISRATVIAESCPQTQHFFGRRLGELLYGRKLREELFKVRYDRRHTSLLEHDFREPNRVCVSRASPREIPFALAKPLQEPASKLRKLRR
jgi:hypothetical protein